MRFFAPQGRRVAPMGVKFGMEEVPSMWNINAPQERILCAIFTTFTVCTQFQDALAVKISLDFLEGLWSYGGFKLRASGYP